MGDAPSDAGLSDDLRRLYQKILRLQSMGHAPASAAAPYLGLALAAFDGDEPLVEASRHNLADRLRTARERLGMSQAAVAEKSGLSERTVKNVEAGSSVASDDTLRRLGWILNQPSSRPPVATEIKANSWLAPKYDCAELNDELRAAVNSTGGTIEQTLLYVDPTSALVWMEMSRSASLLEAFWDRCPVGELAERIAETLHDGKHGAELIALGCGDGRNEIRLAASLRDRLPRTPLRVCLLDISHVLLTAANAAAQKTLTPLGVETITLHANFHRLARYSELTQADTSRTRRIWTLFGYTLSNLDDEPPFFATLDACAKAGDLLLLDLQTVWAPADQPDLVRARDPGLRRDAGQTHERWLTSAFHTHCRDLLDVQVSRQLETATAVPGSYAINWQAQVRTRSSAQPRLFNLARSRRYDPEKLAQWLAGRGWGNPRTLTYGAGEQPRQAVLLLDHV